MGLKEKRIGYEPGASLLLKSVPPNPRLTDSLLLGP